MSTQKNNDGKPQPTGYVLRAVQRIIVPKGSTSIEVKVGKDNIQIDAQKKAAEKKND